MANTVTEAFAKFDAELNLDPAQRQRAQDRHREIREVLEGSERISGSFLQGSFARKTMLKPLKDVDVVILLNPDKWPGLTGPYGPEMAIAHFQARVAAHWPTAQFDVGEPPAGKALRVVFDDLDFFVDLVPALDAPGRYFLIGDRFEQSWTRTNARVQADLVTARNRKTGGEFVHQVRMLKAAVKSHPELAFVTGIVCESIAYQAITEGLRHPEALARALKVGAQLVEGRVLEPAGDDDVSEKWTWAQREAAKAAFAKMAAQAQEALDLEAGGDHAAAIDVWHDLAGASFPQAPPMSEAAVLDALAGGSLTSTQRPSATLAGATLVRPARAWRSR